MPCPMYCYYKWWGEGIGGGVWFKLWCGCRTGDGYHHILFVFFFWLCILFSHVLSPFIYITRAWWPLCLFLCFLCTWSFEIGVTGSERDFFVCCVKLFQKLGIWSLFCEFPWKRECFDLNHFLGCLPYSTHHN